MTLPLEGRRDKPKKFAIFRTKKDMILLLFTPVKCDTRGVNRGKLEDTLAGNEHVINVSRNRSTEICCSILDNRRMVNGVKYSPQRRYLHNQSSEFKVITYLQSVNEPRNFREFQILKLPLWLKISVKCIELSRLKKREFI